MHVNFFVIFGTNDAVLCVIQMVMWETSSTKRNSKKPEAKVYRRSSKNVQKEDVLRFLRDLRASISIIFKESWRVDFGIFELPPKSKGWHVFVEFARVTFTRGTTGAMLISSVLIDCFIALPYLKILSYFNHKGHFVCKHSRSLRSINNELLRFLSMQAHLEYMYLFESTIETAYSQSTKNSSVSHLHVSNEKMMILTALLGCYARSQGFFIG